jgi:hypothetical protein
MSVETFDGFSFLSWDGHAGGEPGNHEALATAARIARNVESALANAARRAHLDH